MTRKTLTPRSPVSLSARIVGFSALAALLLLAPVAQATDRTWNGGGGDNNWTTGANWGGTAPEAGDPLFFGGATRLTPSNDFAADTDFGGITFNSGAGAFSLGGNRITLGGNVATDAANHQTIGLAMILGAVRTFNVSGDGDLTVSGDLSGDGGLTKTGEGTLVLSGVNTFTNGITVSAGTLAAGSATALGNNVDTIAVAAGATLNVSAVDVTAGSARIEIEGNGVNGIGALYRNNMDETRNIYVSEMALTGDATFTTETSVSRQFLPSRDGIFNMNGFTLTKQGAGTLTLRYTTLTNAGDVVVNRGYLRFQDCPIHSQAPITITVNSGARLDYWSTRETNNQNISLSGAQFVSGTTRVNTFTGTITLTGANNEVGSSYQYPTMHLLGKITGSGGFVTLVSAANRWVTLLLANDENDYAGDTIVSDRNTLRVSNTAGSATGSGAVTVQSGGTLEGAGIIGGNLTVNAGGILSPADETSSSSQVPRIIVAIIGTLTVNSNLTLNEDAVLRVDFDATESDLVAVGGTVTLPSAISLTLNNLDSSSPDSIALITAAGGFVGDPKAWDAVEINGTDYRFSVVGNTLQLAPLRLGTMILLR